VILTEGKICERAAMRKMLKPGEFYLGDRNYGADHALFPELVEMGCGFVLRMRDGTVWEVIENHPISPAAAAEGVTLDAMVRIGHKGRGGVQRVVVMKRPGMTEPLVLVTSEAPDSLSALEVLALYRHRWEVEIFFRWLKCLVPCRHWFAESPEGVKIQIYLCLIKALLLAGLLGSKPNKRMMELLRWHQLGWASDEELARLLAAEEAAKQRRAAKKKKA
jgi:IS4 transposase